MKNIALIISIITLSFNSKAAEPIDTIGHQIAYYNGVGIANCSIFFSTGCEITLKLDSIQPTDSLGIFYGTDTPCHDCECYISVQTDKHHPVCYGKALGEQTVIKVSLYEIKQFIKSSGKDELIIFHGYSTDVRRADADLIFRLKFK